MRDDDDLDNTALRRALDHAPDRSAVPDFRVGKTIRRIAHDALGPSDPAMSDAALTDALDLPWWRQWFGRAGAAGRAPRGRPWNAAFATVLAGVLVTLIWQRAPVPGPQLDSEAPAQRASPPSPEAPPATVAAPRQREAAAPPASPRIALPPTVAEAPPVPPMPPTPQAPQAPQARRSSPGSLPPAAPAAGAPATNDAAIAAVPNRRTARADTNTDASGARGASAIGEPSVPAEAPRQPSFAALAQWTRLTIVPANGESRSFARADARDLGTLLGSAALSAVNPQPLRSRVEWRVTLERDGKPIAQLELARGEVRWRESGFAAATGQPPEGALDGLREALREATAPAAVPAPQPEAPR